MSPEELARLLGIARLPYYLNRLEKDLVSAVSADDTPLVKPITNLINLHGKRLRPSFVFCSALICGAKVDNQTFIAAKAIELVHLASLVHNDLLDKSKQRRGQASVHQQAGLNLALLTGDYLLAVAGVEATRHSQALASCLSETVAAMAEGQAQQFSKKYKPEPSNQFYLEVIQKKTARLFEAACLAGALSAGTNSIRITSLRSYGRNFGKAFQIIDDLFDGEYPKNLIPQAVAQAKKYNTQAEKALKCFDSSPIKQGLSQLPDYYLNWALSSKVL